MNTLRAVLIISLFSIFITGCDKFDDKRFSTTIPYVFEVELTDSSSTHIDLSGEITSLINEQLNEVKDEIKSYELKSITYKVWEFYGISPNTFTGSVGFGNANANTPGVIYSYNDIDLEANNANPDQVMMNLSSQDIANIQQYFMDTNGLRMFFTGDVDAKPVHFKMQVIVNIDAIAEVKKK